MGEWLDKLEYIHAMEHYTAKNRNGLLVHKTTWMNLQGIILHEKSQS